MNEESHWDALFYAKSLHCEDSIKVVGAMLQWHYHKSAIMTVYLANNCACRRAVSVRAKTKRNRLHLPSSSQDSLAILANHGASIDEVNIAESYQYKTKHLGICSNSFIYFFKHIS